MHSLHALDQKFAILDELPESLYALVITHSHGELHRRAAGVLQWRAALLTGELPSEEQLSWPERQICRTILMRLEVLDIVQYCRQQEELTDSVLESILEGISSAEDFSRKTAGVDGFDDKQAQRQKIRDRDSQFEDHEGLSDHLNSSSGTSDEAAAGDSQNADSPRDSALDALHTPQQQSDSDLSREDEQPAAESRSFNPGDDNTSFQLQAADPAATEEPQIASTDATSHSLDTEASQQLAITAEHSADYIEKQWQELAESWHELSGVFDELGGLLGRGWDLSRGILASGGWRDIIRYRKLIKQLPYLQQLVAMLGRLREISGRDDEQSITEQIFTPVKRIVDVEEDRRCYVYSFSGPEQVLQHELNLTTGGLASLLQFLQQSFHGGTDVTQPLIEALRKQQQQGWEQADILLVSDGRFPPQPQLAEQIRKAKATQELRLHGVLLGNWRGKALSELCDPVHRFSDWDLQEAP